MNSNVDQMVRRDKFPVDELSELEPISDFEQSMVADEGKIHDTSTLKFVENINVNSNTRLVDMESNMIVTGRVN